MAEIGKRIKSKREELGITQEELANRLGYKSKTTIAKIESGANDIVQSKVIEFAKVLNTTPAYLMGWEDNEAATDSPSYYLDDDAREMAEFMHKNPEYRVLFDASKRVRKEDIQFIKEFMDRMRSDEPDDTGC